MTKTGMICTIGPSCDSQTVLWNLMLAGMDVARLNFSHGTLEEQGRRIKIIRDLNRKYRRHIRILQDLEGYRVRIGALKQPVELKKRQQLVLTNQDNAAGGTVPFDYQGSLQDIKPGNYIYIDDGNIVLVVRQASKKAVTAEVVTPGVLKEHKGVNIPGVRFKFRGLTEKDEADLAFGIREKVDFIAQSFVRTPEDILRIREITDKALPECRIIAKIENREGIKNLDRILKVSDGILIARGDMGVSLPIYEIPVIQKEIIRKCNRARKIVITATQMLESMTENLRPTRAEVTDVANAIWDGSDYVMLSAETAAGKYPVQAARMMNQIISYAEKHR